MGDVHPPLRTFVISDFVLQDTKNVFCHCCQNYLKSLWSKFSMFQMSGRCFLWHSINPELFSDIFVILQFLATASVIKCIETLDFDVEYVC